LSISLCQVRWPLALSSRWLGPECEGGFTNLHFFSSTTWTFNQCRNQEIFCSGFDRNNKIIDKITSITWPNQGSITYKTINKTLSSFCHKNHLFPCSGGARVTTAAFEVCMGITIGKGLMCSSSIGVSDVWIDKIVECDAFTRSGLCGQTCELQDTIKDNWMQIRKYIC
jgi:hypothetical protein